MKIKLIRRQAGTEIEVEGEDMAQVAATYLDLIDVVGSVTGYTLKKGSREAVDNDDLRRRQRYAIAAKQQGKQQ